MPLIPRLERRLTPEEQSRSNATFIPLPLSEMLRDYKSQAITESSTSFYSKLDAIGKLPKNDAEDLAVLVRAILTDRGLLFPQTRERCFTAPAYSKKRNLKQCQIYPELVPPTGPNSLSLLGRMCAYAKGARRNRKIMLDDASGLITMERIKQGLECILKPPFTAPTLINEDPGYCKGELARLERQSEKKTGQRKPMNADAANAIVEDWLKTVQLQFGQQEPFSGPQYLRDELNFTTSELYEFFAYILPDCIRAEEQYQICRDRTRKYEPVLASSQEGAWKEQVKVFQAEDLSQWRMALPAMNEYLHPDLERYKETFFLGDCHIEPDDQCAKILKSAFVQYLSCMEPHFPKREEVAESAAASFAGAYYGKERKPLFGDTPTVIWQLFRSPVYRYFYQLEDRNWNLGRTIEHACIEFPLPVTAQSLKADEELYRGIVTACDMGCRAIGIPFQQEIWSAFWPCLQQSVQCLSFQKEDLFSVQYQFRGLLRFQNKGYPVLDELLSERLEAEFAASYIDLWRGLMKRKTDAPNRGGAQPRTKAQKLTEFREVIKTYRGLFQDPAEDEEQVWDCLLPLCKDLRFNKIHFLPDGKEFKELATEWKIAPRARVGTISNIKCEAVESVNWTDRKDVPHIRAIEMILTEWTVLQCACEQARRELMEAIRRLFDYQTA